MDDNLFEQIATKYDTEHRIELAKVIAAEVRAELQDSQSKTLMDYGSGTGLVSLELCDVVDSILLVDSAKQMLGCEGENFPKRNHQRASALF